MGRRKNTPAERHFTLAHVVRTEAVGESFVRVTLGGLESLEPRGDDHWCRLFFARAGQDVLQLPTRTSELGWYLQYLGTPKARRPWVRAYTLRHVRQGVGEVDIDFVVHVDADGKSGPASQFALTAAPGAEVGFLDQGAGFTPDHPHDWTLLVGDESALPAIAGICAGLPDAARGIAFVEVPTKGDRLDFPAPVGMDVRWFFREEAAGEQPGVGALALEALRAAELPTGDVHAHCIGESSLATGARRHLVVDRGVPKRHADFVGYWKQGRAATS